MLVDLTKEEQDYILSKVSAEALVYMGHNASGLKMTKEELDKMEWLKALSNKLRGS